MNTGISPGSRISAAWIVRVLSLLLLGATASRAGIIGTNHPAEPVTLERIARLPEAQRSAWRRYLEASQRQAQADRNFFVEELRRSGPSAPTAPAAASPRRKLPLKQSAEWYASPEARGIAEFVISFQTPAGGWSKNLDLTTHRRAAGESFDGDTTSKHRSAVDFDAPQRLHWSYVGTFDNSATITELRFLAKVIGACKPAEGASPRRAFLHGLDYILAAQYPNGGWPQVWPLEGGYHDAITYNDDAMVNVMRLLREVGQGGKEFDFVPEPVRARALAAFQRGLTCILETQIVAGGIRTVWGQQHDALSLQPTAARNYEMPAQAGSESLGILRLLLQVAGPDAGTAQAIRAAAAWYAKTGLRDVAFRSMGDQGRLLVEAPGAPLLWARYYEMGSNRPIFGDRDLTIHDTVAEISKERRNGYGWFTDEPNRVLEEFAKWSAAHPRNGEPSRSAP